MQKNNVVKVVIDTNVWIHFLISGKPEKFERLIATGTIRILFSIELLQEITVTTTKPKLKKYFGPRAINDMLSSLEEHIVLVSVQSEVSLCRDISDNFLLSLAKDGNADYLISGDMDLLEISEFEGTSIVTITNFLSAVS